jgi:cytochrome P450
VLPVLRGSILCADGTGHHAHRQRLLAVFRASSVAALADVAEGEARQAIARVSHGSAIAMLDALLRAELERGPATGSAAARLLAARVPEEELLAELRALLIVGERRPPARLPGVELLARHPYVARTLAQRDGEYAGALAHEVLHLRPSVVDEFWPERFVGQQPRSAASFPSAAAAAVWERS